MSGRPRGSARRGVLSAFALADGIANLVGVVVLLVLVVAAVLYGLGRLLLALLT